MATSAIDLSAGLIPHAVASLPGAVRRNIAATGMKIVQGQPQGSAVASVDKDSPDVVEIDDPKRFAGSEAQTLAHESTHLWQNNLPPEVQARIPADNPKDPYNFGGTEGLKAARAAGKTLTDLPREQQAALVQYFVSQGGAEAPQHIKEAYEPWVNDMAKQPLSTIMPTKPGQEGIETAARPPQGELYATETYAKGDPAPGDIDLHAGLVPKAPMHNLGPITGYDHDSGLPIVKRQASHEEAKQELASEIKTPSPDALQQPVGATEPESGRTVTQPSDRLPEAQKLATAAAPELKAELTAAIKGIPGAKLDGVREEKDPKRAREKATKQDQPVETISDLLAARIAVDSPQARDEAVAAVKKAFPLVKDEDKFEKGDPEYGFRSHDLQLQMSNGSTAELQIVPKEIADAESATHENYEQGRKAELEKRPADAQAAQAANRKIHDDAMDRFNARQKKPGARVETLGIKSASDANKIPGESTKAASQDASEKPSTQLKRGQHVLLPDGRSASVDFHDHKVTKNARVTADDGERIQSIPGKSLTAVTSTKAKENSPHVCVDLDGTLAKYTTFQGATVIGAPIPAMIARVKEMLAKGEDVRIFSARIADDKQGTATRAIEAWCQKNIGQTLPITNLKDGHMKALYDDRAIAVEKNTGKILNGEQNEARSGKVLVASHYRSKPNAT